MNETSPLRKKLLDLAISGKLVPKTGEWKTVKLGEVCCILDSLRKPITKKNRKPGTVPYYGATCIQDYVEGYIFDEPLVLLGEDGAKWGPGDKSAFCIEGKSWVNNHAHVLRPNRSVNHDWLVCYLEQADLRDYITGTTVPKLNQEKMRSIPIPLPPLVEQKAIVKRLEELLALEREIAADSAALDDLITAAKRKILDLAVSGKLVPKTGEWKTVSLSDICEIIMGQSPDGASINDQNGVEFHQGKIFFTDYKIAYSKDKTISPTRMAPAGSILLCVRAPVGKINYTDRELCIGRGLAALVPTKNILLEYLYFALLTLEDSFNKKATGSTFKAITKKVVCSEVIPLPPRAEQKAIVKRVEELFAVLDAMKEV